jgi:hypothetical protein
MPLSKMNAAIEIVGSFNEINFGKLKIRMPSL